MKIHQLVHTLNYGDAISGEALSIKRLLDKKGISGNLYVAHAHEKVKSQTVNFGQFLEDRKSDDPYEPSAVILHYSIGSPLNKLYSELRGMAKVMIYHNLTPERWFLAYNARVVADLRQGRSELRSLADLADILLADSSFNKSELENIGCRNVGVLPLVCDPERWSENANSGIAQILSGHGGKNLLTVGRLAPNKCIEDVLKAFYFYHHKIEKKSRLWIVGGDVDTEIYSFELRQLVSELQLEQAVTFAGAVSDGELRAFYENADCYISMSEHEGFCVPILEAMHFGVPVIAFNAGAVSETLGEGGVMLTNKSPGLTAELLNLILSDKTLQSDLRQRGSMQVEKFSVNSFVSHLDQKLISKLDEQLQYRHRQEALG